MAVSGTAILVLLSDGQGQARLYQTLTTADPGSSLTSAAVGDFNGDGHPDIVAADYNLGRILLFAGKVDWSFAPPVVIATPFPPKTLAAGDFDEDGHLDIAFASWESAALVILGGDGTGQFTERSRTPMASAQTTTLLVGDFDGDHHTDLAAAHNVSTNVEVFFGKGTAAFESGVFAPTGAYAETAVSIADLDNDGYGDLVAANWDDGTVTVSRNSGGRTFGVAVPYSLPSPSSSLQPVPVGIAVADFTGDGVLDVTTIDSSNGRVAMLRGRGDGTLAGPDLTSIVFNYYYSAPAMPRGLARFDADEDGRVDLAVIGISTAGVNLARNRCGECSLTVAPVATLISVGVDSTVTVSLAGIETGAPVPTGTVELKVAGNSMGTQQLTKGATTFTINVSAPGDVIVSAAYGGDLNYTGRTSTAVQHVTANTTTTTVTPPTAKIFPGQYFTLKVTVTSNTGDLPSGTVIATDPSQTSTNSAYVYSGVGQFSLYGGAAGAHTLRLTYVGDATHPPSYTVWSYTVEKGSANPTWSPAPPILVTTEQPFSATVAMSASSPTGSVSLLMDGRIIAQQALTGYYPSATFTIVLPAGSHVLIGRYSGDNTFASADTPVAAVRSIGGGFPMVIDARSSQEAVTVRWTSVSGAALYRIYRAIVPGPFTLIYSFSSSTPITDAGAPGGPLYLYKAEAVSSTGAIVATSNVDAAMYSSFTDDPVAPGVVVKAVHFTEIISAINAMRSKAGLSAVAFTEPPVPGGVIRAADLLLLRNAMVEVYSTVGATLPPWAETIVEAGPIIRASHIQELRDAIR